MAHPLELAACPSNDIGIDPSQGGTQLRRIEVTVVADPAADARVVHRGQFGQGQVTAMVKLPASDFPANALQRLWASGRPTPSASVRCRAAPKGSPYVGGPP